MPETGEDIMSGTIRSLPEFVPASTLKGLGVPRLTIHDVAREHGSRIIEFLRKSGGASACQVAFYFARQETFLLCAAEAENLMELMPGVEFNTGKGVWVATE